jgi:hypothetical protein
MSCRTGAQGTGCAHQSALKLVGMTSANCSGAARQARAMKATGLPYPGLWRIPGAWLAGRSKRQESGAHAQQTAELEEQS